MNEIRPVGIDHNQRWTARSTINLPRPVERLTFSLNHRYPRFFSFQANPCQHPIVILRDVASSDMESLLRFMYHGEVHVGQEQLAAFLKTAQMLQVRGLADVNSGAATAKIPPPSSSGGYNGSAPVSVCFKVL